MATEGNNMNKEIAETREAFFSEGEIEYFRRLLKNPPERLIHYKLVNKRASDLHRMAMELIEMAEAGQFNEEEMFKIEYLISHYLGAIEDLHRVLIKERTPNKDDEMER